MRTFAERRAFWESQRPGEALRAPSLETLREALARAKGYTLNKTEEDVLERLAAALAEPAPRRDEP